MALSWRYAVRLAQILRRHIKASILERSETRVLLFIFRLLHALPEDKLEACLEQFSKSELRRFSLRPPRVFSAPFAVKGSKSI